MIAGAQRVKSARESTTDREETNERGHGRYDRHEAADISRPRRALPEHCALQLRHHPFLRGSDRHLSRLYETLRWLRRASGAECFDAARLPAATGLGLFPWRPGILWRRSARRGISYAAARAHVRRADGDRDLLARRQRILLLEPARRLGVPVAVNDPLCSDLLPRRRTLRRRSHDRQRVLEHNPSQTV